MGGMGVLCFVGWGGFEAEGLQFFCRLESSREELPLGWGGRKNTL